MYTYMFVKYMYIPPTFALTFSNEAGLTSEKHIKNTSWRTEGRRGREWGGREREKRERERERGSQKEKEEGEGMKTYRHVP